MNLTASELLYKSKGRQILKKAVWHTRKGHRPNCWPEIAYRQTGQVWRPRGLLLPTSLPLWQSLTVEKAHVDAQIIHIRESQTQVPASWLVFLLSLSVLRGKSTNYIHRETASGYQHKTLNREDPEGGGPTTSLFSCWYPSKSLKETTVENHAEDSSPLAAHNTS